MNTENERLLERLQKETDAEGLEFGDGIDEQTFATVMDRLAKAPPLPKRQRKRRKRSTKRAWGVPCLSRRTDTLSTPNCGVNKTKIPFVKDPSNLDRAQRIHTAFAI